MGYRGSARRQLLDNDECRFRDRKEPVACWASRSMQHVSFRAVDFVRARSALVNRRDHARESLQAEAGQCASSFSMQITINGFVGGPNGELDWIFQTMGDDLTKWIVDGVGKAGVHIMGSRTFHDMAAHWPTSTEPFAKPMNDIPKVVFSKDPDVKSKGAAATTGALESATRATGTDRAAGRFDSWRDAKVATAIFATEIGKLKREPGGNIVAHGGAGFVGNLRAARTRGRVRPRRPSGGVGSGARPLHRPSNATRSRARELDPLRRRRVGKHLSTDDVTRNTPDHRVGNGATVATAMCLRSRLKSSRLLVTSVAPSRAHCAARSASFRTIGPSLPRRRPSARVHRLRRASLRRSAREAPFLPPVPVPLRDASPHRILQSGIPPPPRN